MPVHNSEIAGIFNRLADLLEIEGANPFRVRAYRNAARMMEGFSVSMADAVKEGKNLADLPNIGKDLGEKIKTIVETGRLPALEEVERRTPKALSELLEITGLGAKRVARLYKELKIRSIEDLEKAVERGKVRDLEGFGAKTEEAIRTGIERLSGTTKRTRLLVAEELVGPLVAYLRKTEGVKDVEVAGSYRRRRETVGDLDILVTRKKGAPVMPAFVAYDEVNQVVSHGSTRSTVILRSGMQVDLRVVPQVSYGAALQYFTGSKAHNIAVRKLAVQKDLKINEYGVFKGDKRVAGKTEEEVYHRVGLPYIEPELREDRGEIEAATKQALPRLVALKDIRGDLHTHSKASDGHHTLREMAEAAAALGYDYIANTDHSQRVTVARGLNKKRLSEQLKEIDRLNRKLETIVILKAIELDILDDGRLDLPDDVLKELDLRVCAVHYKFNLSREKQTERILRAMDSPYFNILAHPTGRMINEREPYELDLERIMVAAKERGCFLEVNGQPSRLDLNDALCKMAKEAAVKIAISTDAHSTSNLDYMRLGIDQARRGWLGPDDVINTRSLRDLRELLKRT
jgi:DNA polymerase (family 10)